MRLGQMMTGRQPLSWAPRMKWLSSTRATRAGDGVIGVSSSKMSSERSPRERVPTMLEPDVWTKALPLSERASSSAVTAPRWSALAALTTTSAARAARASVCALLVHEGMLGVVAEQLKRFAGGLHCLLEAVDEGRRAPVVLVGEMRLQRDFHVGGFCRLLRRDAVEHDTGSKLRNLGGADDGHRAAEAEAREAHLGTVARGILRGTANVLRGGVHEVEGVHLFAG